LQVFLKDKKHGLITEEQVILKNYSGGTISTEFGVRRINFVQSEKSTNSGGIATGLAKLGGPDNGGTRLWWDVDAPNF
jgi:hypothetical protein